MKKIAIIITILMLLTGCDIEEKSENYKKYESYINELQDITPSENVNFQANVTIEKISDYELMYILTIDNAKENAYEIEAIITHNKETEDVFPTSGIFEDKIDLTKNGDKKGIRLIGFIKTEETLSSIKINFKTLIKYKNEENEIKTNYFMQEF